MKVLTVVGARPQFVKAAVVSAQLRAAGLVDVLVHTGQHYDRNMSDVFFGDLGLPEPCYNLGIGGLSHGAQTGRTLEALEPVIDKEAPDWVLVYGDTNSTLAGALAAVKLHIPVAHVEAGLRSFNRHMPEEINRVVADAISTLLFAPTEAALRNLRREGASGVRVRLVGDVMYDAVIRFGDVSAGTSKILHDLSLRPRTYVLATVHRAENTDDSVRLGAIIDGLARSDAKVVFPLHPRTRSALERAGLLQRAISRLRCIEPVGYLDMLALERNASLIITDSGGVQKEAYFCAVPCVTVRHETEWTELLESGWNRLAPPTDPNVIASSVREALVRVPSSRPQLYGDGHAAELIVSELIRRDHANCESPWRSDDVGSDGSPPTWSRSL